jgi:hypothetical protein
MGEGGGRALAEALRLNTTVTSLDLGVNDMGEGGALAEILRLNTTLESLNLRENGLGEGGGRALAEALRLTTTLASLNLYYNGLGEGGGRALAEALRLNAMLTSLNLGANDLRVEVRAALRQRVQVRSAIGQAWGPIGEVAALPRHALGFQRSSHYTLSHGCSWRPPRPRHGVSKTGERCLYLDKLRGVPVAALVHLS